MTFSFRHLPVGDGASTQNFEQLLAALNGVGPFVRLAVEASRRVSLGSAVLEWPGASHESHELEVKGLPGTSFNRPFIQPLGAGFAWFAVIGAVTGLRFKVTGWAPNAEPAAGTKAEFFWVAFTD